MLTHHLRQKIQLKKDNGMNAVHNYYPCNYLLPARLESADKALLMADLVVKLKDAEGTVLAFQCADEDDQSKWMGAIFEGAELRRAVSGGAVSAEAAAPEAGSQGRRRLG